MELVCFQGLDKENWAQINALIKRGEWDKVLILKDKGADEFQVPENCKIIPIDCSTTLSALKENMTQKLKLLIGKDFEVALSLASGKGKEHMALISALLSVPVGIRLVAFTKKGVEFIN